MKNKIKYLILLVLFLVTYFNQARAQAKFNIYYLSVGSAHYLQDFTQFEEGFNGFNTIISANRSATHMSQLFNSFGAKGRTLLSSSSSLVTRKKVFDSIAELTKMVKTDKKQNPLLVFYFCGHGLSEGFGWNQFLIPGDLKNTIKNNDLLEFGERSIYAGDVYDILEKAGIPFMMLLDCCYEGGEEKIDVRDYAYQESLKKIAELVGNGMKIVRNLNEFHEPNPVVFSASPGTLAEVVPFDINGQGGKVGPLCRRSHLAFQSKQSTSLEEFINHLQSSALEKTTKPAITNWEPAANKNFRIK